MYDSTTEGISRGANGCRSIASSIGTTTGGSSASLPIRVGEELDHRRREGIVLVAGHHVPGAGDVDVARVRHDGEEGARAVLADDVALPASHQERGDPDGARGRFETLGILRGVRTAPLTHEAGIPVPAEAAVGPEPQVLAQPVQIARPRTMRHVAGDRVGGLLEGGEAVRV